MDFDDLEAELEERVAAGEEVAGYVVENHQPRQGEVLELADRSWKVAAIERLPEKAKKKLPPRSDEEKKPVLRLLCIHGVADSFEQGWTSLELFAPPEIEVIFHEFPGHGHRAEEEILGSTEALADDAYEAFKEIMDTGSFAFMGHSIGCLIVTEVCKRARAKLGVEPVMVFMVERAAPIWPLFTEKGYDMLKNDTVKLFEFIKPNVIKFYNSAGALGQRTFDMWAKGWRCENETLEVGYHVFKCPLVAIYAEYESPPLKDWESLPSEEKSFHSAMGEIMYFNKIEEGGGFFCGHFPAHSFEQWIDWTENKEMFKVIKCPKTDHESIKSDEKFVATLVDYCNQMIKQWSVGETS